MRRSTWQHVLLSSLTLAVVLALGWFNQRYYRTNDVTANERHSLTPATVSAIEALDVPVEIIAALGPNPEQRRAVRALVSRYQSYKPNLTLRFLNPETDPASARELNVAPGGELIISGGGREQRLNNLSERTLTGALRQLSRSGDRQIAFVTGHEERSPVLSTNSDWGLVSERLASIGLITSELSLITERAIDEQIDVVVIAAPRRPYFAGETSHIMNYVQNGGSLLWLVESPINGQTGPALSVLGTELGIDTLPGKVIDAGSQGIKAGAADFVLLDQFPPHPVTAGLSSPILLPETIAFSVTPLAGQVLLPLLQTPESSWTETGELAGEISFDEDSGEVAGPLLLGITIEREIAGSQQRMAVIGDADFGASQYLGNGANQALIESLFIWLAGDSDALDFVTQPAPDAELELNAKSIIILSAGLLVGLPLSLLLTGGLVAWRQRRS